MIDFYWDLGSTNSYFALKLLEPLARKYDAPINWHPFNVGFVFRSNNYVLMEEPKAKLRNRRDDLMRWAEKYDLPFQMPDLFPIKTSAALRGAIAMREWGKEVQFIRAIFSAYWEKGDGSIAEPNSLASIASELGVDPRAFIEVANSDPVRDAMIDSTNDALERGVFGVPSIIVNDRLFWGKDRMEFVEDELRRSRK